MYLIFPITAVQAAPLSLKCISDICISCNGEARYRARIKIEHTRAKNVERSGRYAQPIARLRSAVLTIVVRSKIRTD
jgi:hypothetical protein